MRWAKKQGIPPAKLNGTIQNDILKEYSSRGTYIFPPKPSMRIITNTFEYCTKEVPNWNTISISGYHMREAGCTAVQEVAFTLSNGIAYVEAALKAGLDVDEFGPRLSFFFNAHLDFLEEVAKYRAARRLWSKIMKDRFKAKNPRSWMLRFHTQTAGFHPYRATAFQQHHTGWLAGSGRSAGWNAISAHQLHGRGPSPAIRTVRADCPANPTVDRL